MAKKLNSLSDLGGLVYSTNPNAEPFFNDNDNTEPLVQPNKMEIRVWLERLKGGKVSTVVKGFEGNDEEAKELSKQLKNLCGAGGSAKNNEIIIQGDHRTKVVEFLLEKGYSKTKKAGG